jgi:hypothetical protein
MPTERTKIPDERVQRIAAKVALINSLRALEQDHQLTTKHRGPLEKAIQVLLDDLMLDLDLLQNEPPDRVAPAP